ncbi:hypothetical protein BAY61_14320 [Prauserella marina]|uniref:Glyoxalase superfamily enzyme, possibly 3-demethylubiquinone-9 3-methyltransferase n=1 Tax=Prauserella marina TaxID=530584 RepID=A0A222VQH5_9PSEU|nr:VOC family protein [Prauserella marina]ASR35981.1 hypothetical protein BAY61_14320 [Prauserella marina]PWV84076.1 putative 3-demethylubiquinone-9 3-methyltransferase (glyoxalase superfamily) [Prauserella marina]SDC30968.1 Glyoxalase superfamily enzyme, possibly 3-demethylubiquinone-9 3-methyltransferase [Prauserella marina]
MATAQKITTFLMFQDGRAEEAMNFYTSLFSDGEIVAVKRYGADGPGAEGTVEYATFALAGAQLKCIDSPVKHEFDFTPSISLWVECDDADEQKRLHASLVDRGAELMPLDNYGFSARFTWVADRFGITWQLNLAE